MCCHTIFVSNRLADGDGRLLVGVLENHDLGQVNAQTVARMGLAFELFACAHSPRARMCKILGLGCGRGGGDLPVGDGLGQLRVAAARQELDRVGGHYGEVVWILIRTSSSELVDT